ncbi:hypothetical protein J6I75_04715 [Pseudidiomarina sp. 1APP75-27a]|uniref:nSTAND1 domain-containing NTPase n=1 Tax=Pseudidiomarina terrestris TaxID=2820060 RepID=UPI002B05758B|nr:hypothetical protein [Pseudidiomarina sp. 1APP75-27a]MEA3587646.1 hypothetical protein [Pseudidiomarina sp. 1APP75-27a]
MIYMMLTATAGVGISVKSLTSRSSDPVAHARLKLTLQNQLGRAAFDEQQGYLTAAAKAAWSTMNGLQRRQRYLATVSLALPKASSFSFVEGSSSAGLAYALALYEQWAVDHFQRPNFASEAVFATGAVSPSGQIEAIEHIEQKLAAVIDEAQNQAFQDFRVVVPRKNQEQVSKDLAECINSMGGHIIYASSLAEVLVALIGNEFDGQPLGRWMPFKGLKEFEVEDAMRFFGRDRPIVDLYEVVSTTQSVTFLTGESGVGKSSLMKAGLIPKLLSQNANLNYWCFSGRGLTLELLTSVIQQLRESLAEQKPCLVFLDQGEALFQGERRSVFDGLLCELMELARVSANFSFVIATRIEYLDSYLKLAGTAAQVYQLSATLNSTEWQQVVSDQAEFSGLFFELVDGLSLRDALVEDALQTPRALPMVEFVLEQIYLRSAARGDGTDLLRFSDYEALGRLNGAIALRADQVVEESHASVRELHALFDYFVGQSSEGVLFIREVDARVLESFADEGLIELVQALKDAGLVVGVADQGQTVRYRFVHESLLSHWQTLEDWVEGNGDYLAWRTRIDPDLQLWLRANSRKSRYLVTGRALLSQAKTLLRRGRIEHGALLAYVQASLKRRRLHRLTMVAGFFVPFVIAAIYYIQFNAVSTLYFATMTERFSIPEGVYEVKSGELASAKPRYAFKYQRGRLLEVSYVDGFGKLLPGDLNGGGSRLKLSYYEDGAVASVQTYSANNQELYIDRYTYAGTSARAWVGRFEESNRRVALSAINPLSQLTFQYDQEAGIDSSARRVIDYDEHGFIERVTLHDAFGNPLETPSGYTAITFERNAIGQVVAQNFVDSVGQNVFDGNGRSDLHFSRSMDGKLERKTESYRDDYQLVTTYSYSDDDLLESVALTNGQGKIYAEVSYEYALLETGYGIQKTIRYFANRKGILEKSSVLSIMYDDALGTRTTRAEGVEAETILNDYLSSLGGSKWQQVTAIQQTLGTEQRVISEQVIDYAPRWQGHAFMYDCERVDYVFAVHGEVLKANCLTSDGNSAVNSMGFASARFSYDNERRITQLDYLDAREQLTNLPLGFSTVKIAYDQSNNITATRFFTAAGLSNPNELAGITMTYDRYGNELSMAFFNDEGTALNLMGFHRIERTFNATGLLTSIRYLDAVGELTVPSEIPYAAQDILYDDRGFVADEDFFNAQGELIEPMFSGQSYQKLISTRSERLESAVLDARRYSDFARIRAVGMMYLYGNDVVQPNFIRAEELLKEVFENEEPEDHAETANLLGTLYSLSVKNDYLQSGYWYRRSVEQKNLQSMYSLANHIAQTKGMQPNNARALDLYADAYEMYQQPPLDIVFGVIRASLP